MADIIAVDVSMDRGNCGVLAVGQIVLSISLNCGVEENSLG